MTDIHRRLMEAKERQHLLQKAVRRREELLKRQREQEKLVLRLELQLEEEQADVDKLTRMSLLNLFYTVLRSKEEQLELERQQALAVLLKLNEAKQLLADIQDDLRQTGDELARCAGADRDYDRAIADKEAELRRLPASAAKLAEMEERIADQTLLVRELEEALTAGRRVLASLADASASLEKAENWGKWDMWGGGGLISTHVKHGHVDDAKQSIHQANRLLLNFRDELADLERSADIHIDVGGFAKLADYWFDGLIADWVVQGRIQKAQEQTLGAMNQIRAVVRRLEAEHGAAASALARRKTELAAWIEQTPPQG